MKFVEKIRDEDILSRICQIYESEQHVDTRSPLITVKSI